MVTQLDKYKVALYDNIIESSPNKETLYRALDVFKNAMNSATAKGVFKIHTANQMHVAIAFTRQQFDAMSTTIYSKDKKMIKEYKCPELEVLLKVITLFHNAIEDACSKGVFSTLDVLSETYGEYCVIEKIYGHLIQFSREQEALELMESTNNINNQTNNINNQTNNQTDNVILPNTVLNTV